MIMVKEEVTDWHRIGQREIRPGSPVGDSVRDDPLFEQLRTELKKLADLPEPGQPRAAVAWDKVISAGREILVEKSKDLLVGSYLCYGLFEQNGYVGLRDGLSCLEALISSHWDSMYPEASRARKSAIEWLRDQLKLSKPPQLADQAASDSCLESITLIEASLRQKPGVSVTGFEGIRALLEKPLRAVPAPSSGVNGVVKSPALEPQSSGEPQQALRKAGDLVRGAARTTREQDSRLAWPYRAIRTMAWLEIDDYPPHIEGKTRIPPPPAHSREFYSSSPARAAWSEILQRSESEIFEFPFWIDLQRFSVAALRNLGPDHAGALQAAKAECENFLRRLPDLVGLKFSDGQSFADAETRAWVNKEILPLLERTHEERKDEPNSGTGADRMEGLRRQWEALAADGRFREALDEFQREMKATSSPREQFLARLQLTTICAEAGQVRLAIGQLEILNQASLRFSLDEWEPELTREMLVKWWYALRQLARESKQARPEIMSQANQVYRRLCGLDPLKALDVADTESR